MQNVYTYSALVGRGETQHTGTGTYYDRDVIYDFSQHNWKGKYCNSRRILLFDNI